MDINKVIDQRISINSAPAMKPIIERDGDDVLVKSQFWAETSTTALRVISKKTRTIHRSRYFKGETQKMNSTKESMLFSVAPRIILYIAYSC